MHFRERHCSLFSIETKIPKLEFPFSCALPLTCKSRAGAAE
jgi:hypothetical protein